MTTHNGGYTAAKQLFNPPHFPRSPFFSPLYKRAAVLRGTLAARTASDSKLLLAHGRLPSFDKLNFRYDGRCAMIVIEERERELEKCAFICIKKRLSKINLLKDF